MKILGIDIGNFGVKTSNEVIFESKVGNSSNILTKSTICNFNNHEYVLGEGNFDNEYRKIKKENYLKLLFGALALSTSDIDNKIVLGLPISQFREDKNELTNMILTTKFEGMLNNKSIKFNIEDVEIYPEGIGTLEYGYEGILVDIGGRTIDCAYITSVLGKRKIENPFSLAIGTLNLYSNFIKDINAKNGLDLNLDDAERIIKNGLDINGEKINIKSSINVFKDFTENLVNRLRIEYPLSTLPLRLTGGGSILLEKPLVRRIKQAKVIENSIFANAIAFKKVGESLWLKR